MDGLAGYVFGYGSLMNSAEDSAAHPAQVVRLRGFRRAWNVAMDNTVSLPGYKHYLDPVTGERPAVFVTFLNIEPAPGAECLGVLLPVTAADLVRLDRRERNYHRCEVTGFVTPTAAPSLPVWTYRGLDAARDRYERGMARGTAVVESAYLEAVERGFADLGLLDEYRSGAPAPGCPVRQLMRVDAVL